MRRKWAFKTRYTVTRVRVTVAQRLSLILGTRSDQVNGGLKQAPTSQPP